MPPRIQHGHTSHRTAVPLDELATTAGFRIEARGDLPLLRYIRAVRPDAHLPLTLGRRRRC